MPRSEAQINAEIRALEDLHDSAGWQLMRREFRLEQRDLIAECSRTLPSSPEACARIAHAQGRLATFSTLLGDSDIPDAIQQLIAALRDERDNPEPDEESE